MSNTKLFVNNFFWKFLERCGSQGISIIVSILLARMIEPSAFGIMSLIYVFTSILNVFVDSGMGVALIQKENADDIDFSSVFYFNIGFGIFLYSLMYAISPLIASFYNMPELVDILRVASLILLVSGLRNVQQAYVSRNMIFRKFFYATIGGAFSSAIIALVMAYNGYGVWALVWQGLSNLIISTIILWWVVEWRPKLVFSYQKLKGLIKYGWKLLASGLLDILYEDLRILIIGKMYRPKDLAYYNMGAQIPYGLINNINTSIDSVFLPTVSVEQNNKYEVKRMMRRAIVTSTFVIFPVMLTLSAVADSFVSIVLTDKWEACTPYLRIFCVIFMLYPINSANLNVIKALGRSDIILKLEIAKKLIGVATILITMWISPLAMAWGMLACSFANQIINSWPNKKILNYSYLEQLHDILPNLWPSLIVAIAVSLLSFVELSAALVFCMQIVTALLLYVVLSKLLELDSYNYIINIVKSYIKH